MRTLAVLASVVVFCTVYALILPATAVSVEEAAPEDGYFLEASPDESIPDQEVTGGTAETTASDQDQGDALAAGVNSSNAGTSMDIHVDGEDANAQEGDPFVGNEGVEEAEEIKEGQKDTAGESFSEPEEQATLPEEEILDIKVDGEDSAASGEDSFRELIYKSSNSDFDLAMIFSKGLNIPESARIEFSEIQPDTAEFKANYRAVTAAAAAQGQAVSAVRFFDISLYDGGKEIQLPENTHFEIRFHGEQKPGQNRQPQVLHLNGEKNEYTYCNTDIITENNTEPEEGSQEQRAALETYKTVGFETNSTGLFAVAIVEQSETRDLTALETSDSEVSAEETEPLESSDSVVSAEETETLESSDSEASGEEAEILAASDSEASEIESEASEAESDISEESTVTELIYADKDFDLAVLFDEEASIPSTATLQLMGQFMDDAEFKDAYALATASAAAENKAVSAIRFFTLKILDGEDEIALPKNVSFEIRYREDKAPADDREIEVAALENGLFAFITTEESTEGQLKAAKANSYRVTLDYTASAGIPSDASLSVREILPGTDEYDGYLNGAQSAVEDNEETTGEVSFARFFDITILNKAGQEITPADSVTVNIRLADEIENEDSIDVLHFDEEGSEILDSDKADKEDGIEFVAESFSVYGIIGTVIETKVLTSDGHNYRIIVSYGPETGIPKNADLSVQEITEGLSAYGLSYEEYVAFTEKTLGIEEGSAGYVRLFDIKIVDKDDHNVKYQPAEGTTVDVRIELADAVSGTELSVVHFSEESTPAESVTTVVAAATAENASDMTATAAGTDSTDTTAASYSAAVSKEAASNDTYVSDVVASNDADVSDVSAINDAAASDVTADTAADVFSADASSATGTSAASTSDAAAASDAFTDRSGEGAVIEFAADGFSVYAIIDAPDPYTENVKTVQDTDELDSNLDNAFVLSYSNNNYFTNSLNSNNAFVETTDINNASEWYFEKVEGQENQYYIYTFINGSKKYMKQKSGNNMELGSSGTAFEITKSETNGKFYIKHASENRWLQHSNGGKGIRLYTDKNNKTNSQIIFTYADSLKIPDDYCELNGKTFGIAYDAESIFCTALMSESPSAGSLAGQDMTKMETQGYSNHLFVPLDSDITEWTFHSEGEDKYYITTKVNGEDQYLTIQNGQLGLVSTPVEGSLIKVTPGSGAHKGCYSFSSGGYTLVVNGEEGSRSFSVTDNANSRNNWVKLAEKSPLTEDDYLIYTAQKISVSDPAEQVIIYTRVWNGSQYEFYAVNYDGTLIRCYDDGDVIKWVGNQYETAVWKLTDHTKEDDQGNIVPNGYYELQNTYSGQYIQPKLDQESQFSNKESFLNLDGRYFQEDYTEIRCWDNTYYSYVSLKVDLENNRVVPCPSAQADDFYFARVKSSPLHLTEVDTVNNNEYGITMKMIDFNNKIVSDRDSKQTEFFGKDSNKAGLLTTDIKDNGYPDAVFKNDSLGNLYNGDYEVNHLFIQSVYDESGYFEYDSTKNYAYLNGSDFEVYDQLGTIERAGNRPTMKHGQFMPYNSLIDPSTKEPWPYSDMYTNTTSVTAEPLSADDPRYGEGLHEIPTSAADYFFGMEMSASFTQTSDGLDAWGHDIIFEFSGDDDFWFYVDGELVLDLGGVHQAMTGSVNFRTGMVTGRDGKVKSLRQIFESNYKARNPQATQDEVDTYLLRFFDNGSTVFRDYSVHTMKIFYMERGAGASNLHMRFNLTAVKPGEITLTKKVTGSDDIDYDLMEFPYQILYKTRADLVDEEHSTWHKLTQNENDPAVTYQGSKRAVKYAESYTPVGETQAYSNVFFLKPGETASINMPDDVVDYKIVECSVNMNIFKSVKANNDTLSGENDSGRHDYETSPATIEDRPEVNFENEVDPDSLRTLTVSKILWDEAGFTVTGETPEEETKEGRRLNGYDDDETTFDFRISMSAQDSGSLVPARNKIYYVKDTEGYYCRWDVPTQRFVSLGINEYTILARYIAGLTEQEKIAVVFETSNSGAVSNIPGGYSIEFRGLPVDSSFKVEEREDEIPEGYSLIEYERDKGSYISEKPNEGTVRANEDPHVMIHNKRGWGLTVNKVWSDADYMESHDDIYFAIFINEPESDLPSLLEGSVRKLTSPKDSLYYYFDELREGYDFDDYEVFEVRLTNPQTDAQGNVTYDTIERIEANNALTIGGKPNEKDHLEGFTYEVTYQKGTPTGGAENVENVREDTVTNTRRGIKLVKTDWNGEALPGAVFTLKDPDGTLIGAKTNTSDENGLITIAYLDPNTEYTLEETDAPNGFQKPSSPWTIRVDNEEVVSVDGPVGTYAIQQATSSTMAVVTFKNKGFSLQALKVGENDTDLLEGAVFALYKQVKAAGGMVKDQNAMTGYEALTTGPDGVIPKITSALQEGVYYLSEVTPPAGYEELPGDLVFTINSGGVVDIPAHVVSDDSGAVVILNNLEGLKVEDWITSSEIDGHVTYTMRIPNELAGVPVKIIKIDQTGKALEGAVFSFSGEEISETGLESQKAQGESDAVIYANQALPLGTYTLTETDTPDGYLPPEAPVIIKVEKTESGITVSASINEIPIKYPKIEEDCATGEWTIKITNQTGYELPHTGGHGTRLIYLLGVLLAGLAVAGFAVKRRKQLHPPK